MFKETGKVEQVSTVPGIAEPVEAGALCSDDELLEYGERSKSLVGISVRGLLLRLEQDLAADTALEGHFGPEDRDL